MNIVAITPETIPSHNIRYYNVLAPQKPIHHCAGHGGDHASFGWGMQLDPTWTQDQLDAYVHAYADQKANG